MQPFEIVIGGSRLETWTEATLERSKDELTGSLSVTIFAGAMPPTPILRSLMAGSEILVYVAGQLAFTGTVDKRQGTGAKKGKKGTSDDKDSKGSSQMSVSIGPNEYTLKITARGKTKRLIDSSHQHPTTNMTKKPKTKKVVEKLVEPWKTKLDWKAEDIELDKIRFRDGARVVDELHRIAMENGYFMYETRDGKLRVTDGVGSETGGDPLILGDNILEFSAEQSEDEAKSKIKVKGQRTDKKKWGKEALEKTFKEVENKSVKDFVPQTVQHYGDGDDKTLERRGRFEANKRNSASKKITIEVFHVQTPSGQPWDIGNTHYVEVPPEGIFDTFECTGLTYTVKNEKTLKTTLTLSPPPSSGTGGGKGGFGLASLLTSVGSIGTARRSQAGISMAADMFPAPWSPPLLSEMPLMTLVEAAAKAAEVLIQPNDDDERKRQPPMTLPPWFGEAT